MQDKKKEKRGNRFRHLVPIGNMFRNPLKFCKKCLEIVDDLLRKKRVFDTFLCLKYQI